MTTPSARGKDAKPEVSVSIDVVDVRFGTKLVQSPEITTLYKGKKVSFKLPMKEPLVYSFQRVEEDMIFKMAVLIAGDLAGFLYLEVPHKFKSLKEFTLDDWFPIKQLDTDENDSKSSTLFTAHIKISYAASRKLNTTQMFLGKVPKQGVHDELARTLKERVAELHAQVDAYNDEGFRHLHDFELKLLKKKAQIKQIEQERVPTPRVAKKDLAFAKHKTEFYRGATQELGGKEQDRLSPEETKAVLEGTVGVEALIRELTFNRKELINVQQRLRGLQEGKLTVDNVALRAKLDAKMVELIRDKKELTLKLGDKGGAFDEERNKLSRETEKEKAELNMAIEELKERGAELEDRAREAVNQVDELKVREKEVENQRENLDFAVAAILRDEEELRKQEEELQEQFEEFEEVKQRMVIERQKVLEEYEEHGVARADLERKNRAADARERGIEETRAAFDADQARRRKDLEKRHDQLKARRADVDQERSAILADRIALDSHLKELAEEKRQMKAEAVRVWREKAKLQEDMKEFAEYKKVIEEEDAGAQADFDSDYKFLDDQLLQIEKGKTEMAGLRGALKTYEKYLEEEHRLLLEQTDRFNFAQKQFFDKLKQSQFDLTELRAFSAKFSNEIQFLEDKFKEHEAAQLDLEKRKSKIRTSIYSGMIENTAEKINARRTIIANTRSSKIQNMDGLSQAAHILQIENRFQAQFEADKLLERVFDRACLHYSKTTGITNDRELETLKGAVEEAEDRLREEQQVSKALKLSLFVKNKAAVLNAEFSGQGIPQAPSFKAEEMGGISASQQDALDLFEVTTNQLKNQLGSAKDPKKIQERIAFVENAHRELNSIFRNLNGLNFGGSEEGPHEFEHLMVKSAYEKKIKFLMDYIIKIRENYEFFNNEVDNQILAS